MPSDEEAAAMTFLESHHMLRDLDLRGYFGKWKHAFHFASQDHAAFGFDWCLAARTHFLELGGCYIHERARND